MLCLHCPCESPSILLLLLHRASAAALSTHAWAATHACVEAAPPPRNVCVAALSPHTRRCSSRAHMPGHARFNHRARRSSLLMGLRPRTPAATRRRCCHCRRGRRGQGSGDRTGLPLARHALPKPPLPLRSAGQGNRQAASASCNSLAFPTMPSLTTPAGGKPPAGNRTLSHKLSQ